MFGRVVQTEKTAFRDICTSGTQDREEATTSPIDTCVKARKVAISTLEMGKLNEIGNLSFLELANKNGIATNPAGFSSISVKAMKRLKEHKKTILCTSFRCALHSFGSNQPGTDDPLFTLTCMPFGLVEYQINFFSVPPILCRFVTSMFGLHVFIKISIIYL